MKRPVNQDARGGKAFVIIVGVTVAIAAAVLSVTIVKAKQARKAALTMSKELSSLTKVVPPEPLPDSRLLDARADETLQDGLAKYRKGQYALAVAPLFEASTMDPSNPAPHFYLGLCYLMTKDSGSAVREFKTVTHIPHPQYSELAHFYLAKAYLKMLDETNAKIEFEYVANLHGPLASEAGKLAHDVSKSVRF